MNGIDDKVKSMMGGNSPYKRHAYNMFTHPVDLWIEYEWDREADDIRTCSVMIEESEHDVWDLLDEDLQGAITEAIANDFAKENV